VDSSTLVRRVNITAMFLGPSCTAADLITTCFEEAYVRMARVATLGEACERLPEAMPQVVVVLGSLRVEEHEALADRATAVGALVVEIDPLLDDTTIEELARGAAKSAIDRMSMSMLGDAAPTRPPPPAIDAVTMSGDAAPTRPPPAAVSEPPDEDVDAKW
jgi:hypothetical protein